MKRIDLHIHTKAGISDSDFNFDIEILKKYVNELKLDVIAITNHNLFDRQQFDLIKSNLDIDVLPGVEVDLSKGHMLVIADYSKIDQFEEQCNTLANNIKNQNDFITYEKFIEIFSNYKQYLLIPHYKKKPSIKSEILENLKEELFCGEVDNAKKWEIEKKTECGLNPVLFSDIRISAEKKEFPIRITYLDINDINIAALKNTLKDGTKIYISNTKKNEEFQINENGLTASTKLNVVIGKRSSGKTYTLEKINKSFSNDKIKYIKQFELIENCGENKFNELIKTDCNCISEDYLIPLKEIISKVLEIDLSSDDVKLKNYYDSLFEYAQNIEKQDVFSKNRIFNEQKFDSIMNNETTELINAINVLLSNEKYKNIIDEKISRVSLIELLKVFINDNIEEVLNHKLKKETDIIVENIKRILGKKSALTPISNVDFCEIVKNHIITQKFDEIITQLKTEQVICEKNMNGYKIVASRKKFNNAKEIKDLIKFQGSLGEAFKKYDTPYNYIWELKNSNVKEEMIYKTLVAIDYKTLNKRGIPVSGGERAEFNLLKELNDAEKYDILLIDEPESSFDNPFIKDNMIQILKELSQRTTVFVVTHNNTLGTLIKPNKIIYTEHDEKSGEFRTYSGNTSDKNLTDPFGNEVSNYLVVIENMEAGAEAYRERNGIYENLKN